MGQSRITHVVPERISLTAHGEARITVRGRGYGLVGCCDDRRWVWGSFRETFVLRRGLGPVRVWLRSLGGRSQQEIPLEAGFDLSPPRVREILPRVAFTPPRVPRLRRLTKADWKPEEGLSR